MVSAQFWGKMLHFVFYSVHVKYWCAANSNLAYFIELTTALECQKQLLMSSISNLGGRQSLEIAVRDRLIFTVCRADMFDMLNFCSFKA